MDALPPCIRTVFTKFAQNSGPKAFSYEVKRNKKLVLLLKQTDNNRKHRQQTGSGHLPTTIKRGAGVVLNKTVDQGSGHLATKIKRGLA